MFLAFVFILIFILFHLIKDKNISEKEMIQKAIDKFDSKYYLQRILSGDTHIIEEIAV